MRAKATVVILVLALVSAVGGFGVGYWLQQRDAEPTAQELPVERGQAPSPELAVGERRPGFTLTTLAGKRRSASDWDGRVLVVNFWATWCAPCREEMPMLDRIQGELGGRGLQVVGIAIDQRKPVRDFVQELGVDYPILVSDLDAGRDAAAVSRDYGNAYGVLPYTVIVDREGHVAEVITGVLSEERLRSAVSPLLESNGAA